MFIAVIQLYVYIYIYGNIINNNDERTHFFRKIYLSHFIRKGCERVVCEKWIGDWTDCNILTPSSSGHSSTSSSFCLAAQPGVLRAQALCWELVLTASNCNSNTNCNWLQLTDLSVAPGYIIVWRPWASQLHRIQPVHGQGYILISSTGCTCFLIDGWVEGQNVTVMLNWIVWLNWIAWNRNVFHK